MAAHDANDPLQPLRDALHDAPAFVQLVLTNVAAAGDAPAYRKIAVRRNAPPRDDTFQTSFYTATQHRTEHLPVERVEPLLSLPFERAHLQTTAGNLHVRVTRKGRVLVSRGKPSPPKPSAAHAHDRPRQHRLPADRPSPLLNALGIQTHAGHVRAARRDKLHQINQFLDVLASLDDVRNAKGTLHVIDCGCGAAYLTFAAHHWLGEQGLDPRTVGIDVNADLIAKRNALRDKLGYATLRFERARIADFVPPATPDLVLSLHACDTATDEAIALGVRRHARAILAAPCCQHELRDQIANDAMLALLRHGVLKSRLADLVTDAVRAALLRTVGYTCDVIEFVSPEHTGKNVMLRAERRSSRPLPGALEDYAALKSAWQISPTLERLLAR